MSELSIEEFCKKLSTIPKLKIIDKAVTILWWHYEYSTTKAISVNEISKIIKDNHLGSPNSTILSRELSSSRLTLKNKDKTYSINQTKMPQILSIIETVIETPVEVPTSLEFLPLSLCENTKGYIESVAKQLNACYMHKLYDAAAVMMRRLVEALLIEAFIAEKKESLILDANGDYFMLAKLVSKAIENRNLPLGKDTRSNHLNAVKGVGDRAAHKRNYNTKKSDLDQIKTPLRVTIEELVNIAQIKRK